MACRSDEAQQVRFALDTIPCIHGPIRQCAEHTNFYWATVAGIVPRTDVLSQEQAVKVGL